MIKQNSLHHKLKEATFSFHRQIEHNPFAKAILQEKAPLETYVQWLIRFYGFYLPLENQIIKSAFYHIENLALKERLKVPGLTDDLKFLGQSFNDIANYPQCNDLPKLYDASNLLGYLYVVEGSTLGGQFIVNRLRQRYGFYGDHGCRFFNGYAGQTGRMWEEFCLYLNEHSCDEDQEKIVIKTALDTFEKLNTWFNTGGLS